MEKPMMQTTVLGPESIRGRLTASIWSPGQPYSPPPREWACNLLQYSGSDIFASLLTGDADAFPAGMYLEFTNNIGAWANPTVGRTGADAYFASLSGLANQDFLRVPFAGTPALSASDPNFEGNTVDFLAMTDGVEGVFGTPFGNASGSYVVGGAVVAVPDWSDRSQDRILCRGYLPAAIQKLAAPAEIVLRWQTMCG